MLSLSRFRKDRSGNVAMLFGLALLPVGGMAGIAVDHSRASAARLALQTAADMTALHLASDAVARSDAYIQTNGETAFRAVYASQDNRTLGPVLVSQTATEVRVEAQARVKAYFGGLYGHSEIAVGTVSAANKRSGLKTSLYLLLDNSASMGLAADEAGRDRLRAITGCAFACHDKEGGQTKSNMQVANERGIKTRVEVMRDAVTNLVDRLDRARAPSDELRVSALSFDDSPRVITPLTSNMRAIKTYLADFTLGGNTSFSNAMPAYNRLFDVQGDGRAKPREFALIVSDGVQGRRDRVGGFKPFDSRLCDRLKSAEMGGITVIVLNTRYVPMPMEQAYRETVAPIQNELEPALKACASPGYYFAATDQAEINKAFDDIFAALRPALRLTM